MPDLELLRKLAPPVEPASPKAVHRARRRMRNPRRKRRPVLMTAPVVAGLLLALFLTQHRQTFAEAAVKAAEASPRLLMEGWKVTRVDEWSSDLGEMTFQRDGHSLDLQWGDVRTIKPGMDLVGTAEVAGHPVKIIRYEGTNDFTAIWGNLNARDEDTNLAEFKQTLAAFHQVGAEDWLKALPASTVAPRAQAGTIDKMLEGIPVPPGFVAPKADGTTRDRYQLGAKITGAVACAWIARHYDGDETAAKQLDTSRQWPILLEMNAGGDFPEVIWQYADALNGRGAMPAEKLGLTGDGAYKEALGVDRTYCAALCVTLPGVARPDYYGNPAGLSEEIELVKAVYEAFAARDRERMAELLTEDCELFFEGTARLAGRDGPYRGTAGVAEYFADVERLWEELELHADDFRAVPGSVIVMGHVTGRRQGLDVRRSSVWTWKLKGGRAMSVKAADLGDMA